MKDEISELDVRRALVDQLAEKGRKDFEFCVQICVFHLFVDKNC